jgi:hypothetical protein
MKVERKAVHKGNAAYLCRHLLGDKVITNWDAFLLDCARDRAEIGGERLLPCGRVQYGRQRRPIYAIEEIKQFASALLAGSGDFGAMPVRPFAVTLDARLPWELNVVDRLGKPLRYSSI